MPAGETSHGAGGQALATPLLADGIAVGGGSGFIPTLGELDWRVVLHAMGSLTVVRMVPVAMACSCMKPDHGSAPACFDR